MKAKHIILVVGLFVLSANSFCQGLTVNGKSYIVRTGVGVEVTNIDAGNASATGYSIALDFAWFHLGVSANNAVGTGSYLAYNSTSTYSADKTAWWIFYLGGVFPLINTNEGLTLLSVRPKLGMVATRDIFNDPVAFDTYYYGETERSINLNVDLIFDIPRTLMYISTGFGTGSVNLFNFSLGLKF